ncbi:MAG: YdeI/OmpD-associated family protein [Vicinamibacterales bacterium]
MTPTDPRVDAYIQQAAPFAKPILVHLRKVVHEACPEVQETMKWSFPHFDYKGIFCAMASFKQHATFGFWKGSLLAAKLPKVDEKAMGQFGRIASMDDLPPAKTLARIVKAAARLNDDGVKVVRARKAKKAPLKPPADLMTALKRKPKALAAFKAFSAGQQREYVEWITEARREATRASRLATAVGWIAEGKPRNWKYMK